MEPDPCTRDHSYEVHARNLHQRATDEWQRWWSSLPPGEKARARSLGLDRPSDDDTEVGGHSPYSASDIADTPLARTEVDFASQIDTPDEEIAERFGISVKQARLLLAWHQTAVETAIRQAQAQYLQVIVGGLLSAKNPKLSAAGLAFAGDLAALNGLHCQREYAKQLHVSPSAISKVVKAWQRALGLRPSAHQKSEAACRTYSTSGKANHWRKRTVSASDLLKRLTPKNPSAN